MIVCLVFRPDGTQSYECKIGYNIRALLRHIQFSGVTSGPLHVGLSASKTILGGTRAEFDYSGSYQAVIKQLAHTCRPLLSMYGELRHCRVGGALSL